MSSDPIKPHHLLWLQAAVQASHRSPRVDNKNGAVIVDTRGTILSTDHNIPRFKDNFERRALYAAHPTWQKNAPCAEARAILAAQQKGLDLTHGTLVTLQGLPAVLHEAAYACAAGRAERFEYEAKVREQKQKAASGG
ncbi:MAG: hypothetical protein EB121_05960 [Alphaproteobacteria bacterium]|nr:hypothetical protein [Alphaproteobacteria bacterium]